MTTRSASRCILAAMLLLPLLAGCAAFRPIHGLPARYLPDEFRGITRSGKQTIDLSLLRQSPPATHLVDTGDLLSIYVEGILGRRDEQPPVYYPQNSDVPPTVGYPIPVRDDGTISLPLVGAVPVRGRSIRQVEEELRRAYTVDQQFLQPGRDRIFVALQQPRTYRVLVIRQEASSDVAVSSTGQLNIGALKRGTGKAINLPVYKNDVLNALAETGGLPGLDAENAIYIIRGQERSAPGTHTPPSFSPPPATSAQRFDAVIRGQSPSWGINPQADYRTPAGTGLPGWTTPRSAPAYEPQSNIQPVQYAAPQPAMPYAPPAPAPMPPLSAAEPMTPAHPMPDPHFTAPNPETPMWTAPQGAWGPSAPPVDAVGNWPVDLGGTLQNRRIIRIPVRLGPGEYTDIRQEDIILYDGDIVFIESRETEVFYTGGLLGGGQYTLPRDYDLDVLGAIAIAQGSNGAGGSGGSRGTQSQGGQSALNADVSISASQLIVLRPLPDGTQLTIQIDLYEAIRNPNERIVVQPGDYLILQYTRAEAVMAFIERHLLEGALFGLAAAQFNSGN